VKILMCPLSDRGYLYPAIAVGRELHRRHHDVQVLARSTAAPALRIAGLPMLPDVNAGGTAAFSVSHWYDTVPAQYAAVLQAARALRPDVLVTSALCLGPLLVAEVLDLPVVVLGFGAHLWNYEAGAEDEPEFPSGIRAGRAWITRELLRRFELARDQVGLNARAAPFGDQPYLGTVTLLRGDPELEYPGAVLPARVHHVGPCEWEPPADPGWLGELAARLDEVGKPAVYVHLGRVFGGTDPWPRLNAMFAGGPFQAVVEQGRSADPRPVPEADIHLVRVPWMGPLIDRSELVLTSGTSAPVLNALVRGRPLGVSPNGSEQPLLAEACVRAGVAVRVRADAADPVGVLSAMRQNGSLYRRAARLADRLAATDSCTRAADFVENAVRATLHPVATAR
jgi:UDP:flavonoid glycosyltransferase YjiC (YdhE family)